MKKRHILLTLTLITLPVAGLYFQKNSIQENSQEILEASSVETSQKMPQNMDQQIPSEFPDLIQEDMKKKLNQSSNKFHRATAFKS